MGQHACPNVLLIFTDQQRWDTIGACGNKAIRTPNLDRMATEGVVFENAFTPCPVCVPARAATVSGYTPSRMGCLANSGCFADEGDTMAAYLSQAGYHTQGIGKMHFTPHGQTYGIQELILSEVTRFVRKPTDVESVSFDDYDKFLIERGMWGWDKPPGRGYNEIRPFVNPLPKECHVTQWCGDRTVEWLKKGRPEEKPFFLWTSFTKPHVPYDCPRHLVDFYDPDDMPEPWGSDEDRVRCNPVYEETRKRLEFDLYSDRALRIARAHYYANVTFIDEQVGRILDTLSQEGLARNTLVIYASDHGDLLGDHGLWYKSFGYEGSMKVPMLAWWPGEIQPGTRVTDIVTLLDIFPTIMSRAGLQASGKRYGRDLFSFFSSERRASREMTFSEIGYPPDYRVYVRHRDWKYIFFQNGGFEELYHLTDDPQELHNLAGDPAHRADGRELKAAAVEWIRQYGSPEIALDKSGSLRSEPYRSVPQADFRFHPYPYSRMPWEMIVPPTGLPDGFPLPWFWKACGGDWSQLIEYARSRSKARSPREQENA